MRRKRPFGTILALLVLAATSCGEEAPAPASAEGPIRLVTVHGSDEEGSQREPHARCSVGTRIGVQDAEGVVTPLPLDLAAAGGPEPMLDPDRVLFVGKADPAEKYGIWSCRRDGSDLEHEVDVNADCGRAAQLPDGRLVYSRSIPGEPVEGMRSRWALYVKAKAERDGRRITFGAGYEIDPTVLEDGRILYCAWQPVGGSWLWTVHPDGTGASRVPGAPLTKESFPLMPYQAEGGDVVFAGMYDHYQFGEIRAHLLSIDWRAPGDGVRAVDDWPPPRRSRPQGHLSMVRPNVPWGQVLGLDAGAGARRIRFLALDGDAPRSLGEVPLAKDGSFFVRLPPDVPIGLETLDESGAVVGGQETPFWVRPNETRACVGCHEDPETTPPNRRPLAVLEDPVDLSKGAPR